MLRTLLNTPNYYPTKFTIRFYYCMYLLDAMWATSLFTAFIYTLSTEPSYEKQINSLAELIQNNYNLLVPGDLMEQIIEDRLVFLRGEL